MQITLSFTGERDQVVLQLREGATQADLEQREFENVLRGALHAPWDRSQGYP